MDRRPHALILLASMAPACADQGLTRFNAEPVAEITSHGPDEAGGDPRILEGALTRFEGRVSDPDDARGSLQASWHLGEDTICPPSAPDADGATACEARVGLEHDRVRLVVSDPEGASAAAFARLEVVATEPPTARILSPEDGLRVYADQRVTFHGQAGDAETAPGDLAITWSSDLDGPLDLDTAADAAGLFADAGTLSQGEHLVTLRVEDAHGKWATDVVGLAVGPPNAAPDCALLHPADDALLVLGEAARLEGLAIDADVPGERLVVTWHSDADGLLGSGPATPTGAVDLEVATLSRGYHALTLTVVDEVDAACADAVRVKVGSPPSVVITSPAGGHEVDEGDALTFSATAADGDDAPDLLGLSWESDLDGVLDASPPGAGGLAGFSAADLSVGAHTVTLTVTDTDGMSTADTVLVEVNGPPTAPVVSISPDPPGSTDDLSAGIDVPSADPDGDPVTYRYAWSRDGATVSAYTLAAVPASATARGETWSVAVTPFDGRVDGPSASASVTVGNGAPSVLTAGITPLAARTGDTLTAAATGLDPDGDPVTLSYDWHVDGVSTGQAGLTLDGASWFDKGQVVHCVVTASDGAAASAPVSSNSVTVLNTAPGAPVVSVSPASPRSSVDDITCDIDTDATDADGDAVTYSFAWTVGGAAWAGATSTSAHAGDTIPASATAAGETWTCTATPSDGAATGTPDSASATTVQGLTGWSSATVSLADADVFARGEQLSDAAGGAVAAAGDVDGDGVPDLFIGAHDAAYSGTRSGSAYVLLGGALSAGTTLDLADADHRLVGEAAGDRAGATLVGGADVDGDGVVDLLVGAPAFDGTHADAGAVYIVEAEDLSSGGTDLLVDAWGVLEGEAAGDSAGSALSLAGDLDGDGLDDLLVGAPDADDLGTSTGAVYVVLATGLSSGTTSLADADYRYHGVAAADHAGLSVSGGADVDGDGADDLMVGAYASDRAHSDGGAAWLLSGGALPADGSDLSSGDLVVTGDDADDYAGYSVLVLDDMDGDGLGEVAVGAWGDDSGGSAAGKAALFFGGDLSSGGSYDLADASHRFSGEAAGDRAGSALATAGDVDRDGLADLLIGAPRNDDGATEGGQAYLLLSGDMPTSRNVSLGQASYGFTGTGIGDRAGGGLAGPGDVNGDGLDDLLVGAGSNDDNATDAGQAYLLLAP